MTYYRLYMKKPFVSDGRQVKNLGGRIVVFENGVAARVDEKTAGLARQQHYIQRVEQIYDTNSSNVVPAPQPSVPQTPVTEPQTEVASADEVETPAEDAGEATEEKYATVEVGAVADVPEIKDGKLYASDIKALHANLKTWTAVAEYLDVSTTTLRNYRDEAGL